MAAIREKNKHVRVSSSNIMSTFLLLLLLKITMNHDAYCCHAYLSSPTLSFLPSCNAIPRIKRINTLPWYKRRITMPSSTTIILHATTDKVTSSDESSASSSSDDAFSNAESAFNVKETTATTTKDKKKKPITTYSAKFYEDNDIDLISDVDGKVTAVQKTTPQKEQQLPENEMVDTATTVVEEEESTTAYTNPQVIEGDFVGTTPSPQQKAAEIAAAAAAKKPKIMKEPKPKVVPMSGFNVVLTHCTADFDSLASAVGLAKLWSSSPKGSSGGTDDDDDDGEEKNKQKVIPTFVVLPRGAHPAVQKFLSLHKHLFPIRSLKSLPSDLSGLHRLGLVDAQRRDRIGPAEHLLSYAKRVTVVDHHIDGETDIPEATDYVVEKVGSVSTMIVERLQQSQLELSEAEATLLALGIHADTGSLCYDSTTPRDAFALSWCMEQGASQAAIAEHVQSSLSVEQQGVLTQALINTNSTVIHGVTVSTVLLSADGFINGLAAVTQDALELSSSDVFLLAVVYDPKAGHGRNKRGRGNNKESPSKPMDFRLKSKLLQQQAKQQEEEEKTNSAMLPSSTYDTESWKAGEEALRRKRLRAAFDRKDIDGSGYLERNEIAAAFAASGVIATEDAVDALMESRDLNGDGRLDFEEYVAFATDAEKWQKEQNKKSGQKACTMIIIGRVKAGINMKDVNLNRLFQKFGGGGHAKAASATARLSDENEASTLLQGLVDELIDTSLLKQPTVGDFMTAPVLSAKPTMNEKQVEDLFTRYDVRALPVVDDNNDVIGLVTYKEVAAAKQRFWNKEQKRLRREAKEAKEAAAAAVAAAQNRTTEETNTTSTNNKKERKVDFGKEANAKRRNQQQSGSALKGWMKQHVQLVEASMTMAEVEAVLLNTDVGCIPVVADGTKQLVGMVTRTDLLRQHRYYESLHYHNKGFADSIAARKPIIELRKKLKKFDLENE
mmetsp:Transcript_29212/g.43432  ORF Transcript_29212/g.43432 Transcript_29212/m.43432 type:complete len:952 (-) Transcript_29212:155-3010(-)